MTSLSANYDQWLALNLIVIKNLRLAEVWYPHRLSSAIWRQFLVMFGQYLLCFKYHWRFYYFYRAAKQHNRGKSYSSRVSSREYQQWHQQHQWCHQHNKQWRHNIKQWCWDAGDWSQGFGWRHWESNHCPICWASSSRWKTFHSGRKWRR